MKKLLIESSPKNTMGDIPDIVSTGRILCHPYVILRKVIKSLRNNKYILLVKSTSFDWSKEKNSRAMTKKLRGS